MLILTIFGASTVLSRLQVISNYQIHHALIEFVLFEHAQKTDTQSHGPFHNGKLSGRMSYGPPVTMQFIFDLLDFSVK